MQTKKDVLLILKNNKQYLNSEFGFHNLFLFGSFALDKQSELSDVDLLVETEKKYKTYQNLLNAKNYLKKRLNREIELVFSDSVNPIIKNDIKEILIKIE